MGEAKRKRPVDMTVVHRAADVVIKVLSETSDCPGYDCLSHATMLAKLLNEQGIPATVRVGYAAWRVNSGDADVIAHTPDMLAKTGDGFVGHAWVEIGDTIVDPTAWQWSIKLRDIEQLAPRGSTVHPELLQLKVLTLRKRDIKPIEAVANGYGFAAYYESRPELRDVLMTNVERRRLALSPEILVRIEKPVSTDG